MGESPQGHPDGSVDGGPAKSPQRSIVRSVVYLAVAAVAPYLLLPSLIGVFSSWRSLEHLEWPFAILVVVFEIASWVCLWELDRIALDIHGWFAVACAQLAGNALGRIVPGSATPLSVVLLRRAGVDGGDAAAALTASTGLQIATALALPILAVPAMIGGAPIDRGLATAAYLGIAVVVLLIAAGVILFATDAPLAWIGRTVQSVLNATVRRRRPVSGLAEEFLSNWNFIRTTLGQRWMAAVLAAIGNTGFDYLALLCALRAVGANPAALAATLLYRLVSYWLPIPVGAIADLLFRRRYGDRTTPSAR